MKLPGSERGLRKAMVRRGVKLEAKGRSPERVIAIVEAAITLLFEEGAENLRLSTIGRRLRMRRSHVAYYFRTKEDVLEAIFKHIVSNAQRIVVEAVEKEQEPRAILEAILRGHFRWAESYPRHVMIMMLFYFHSIRNPRIEKLHREVREQGALRLASVVRLGTGGSPKECLSIAKNIQGLITGNLIDIFTTGRVSELSGAESITVKGAFALWRGKLTRLRSA